MNSVCKIPHITLVCDVERQLGSKDSFKLEAIPVLDFTVNPSIEGASLEGGFAVQFAGTAALLMRGMRTGKTSSFFQPSSQ